MSKPTNKWTVLLVVSLSSVMMPLMGMCINVALPSIGNDLKIDAVLLGWVATSFILASAMFVVPAGRIADIYGRKKIFLCGTMICTATSFILASLNSATSLIIFRVVQGYGTAMVINTGIAIVSSVFASRERGKALGICMASIYIGQTLAPFFGGLLTHYFGWRSIFLANVPLGTIVIILVFLKLKDEWAESQGEKFDIVGSVLYGLMLTAIIYGLSSLPHKKGVWLIVMGLLGGAIFVKWELKFKNPIMDINLFRKNRPFSFSILSALTNYSSVHAIAFLISLYLQYIKGISPQTAGLILVAQPIVQGSFSPLAGRLADKIQPRVVASAGMALTALGLFIFVFLNHTTAIFIILFCLVLIGFGQAFFVSPNTNAIMGSVEKRFYGIASGAVATMRQVGMMLSMALTMLIFSLYMGRVPVTPEYYPLFLKSVSLVFIIYTALSIVGTSFSLARGEVEITN